MAAALLATLACGGGAAEREATWAGSVDTLASGAVRVRNPTEGVWGPGGAWRLVEESRVGSIDGEDPAGFGTVTDLAADTEGRVYVLDAQSSELRAFDASGAHLWSAGRKGEGPGELSGPVGLAVDAAGQVWVVDRRNQRYSAFDVQGTLTQEVRRGRGGPFSNWRGRFDRDGRLVDPSLVPAGPNRMAGGIVRTDAKLEAAESMLVPHLEGPVLGEVRMGRATMSYPVPFLTDLVWAIDAGGDVWVGRTDPYVLALTTFDGDTVRVIERDVDRLPLDAADRARVEEMITELRDANAEADLSLIPDDKPRMRWLEPAPDGHLWVRVFTGDEATPHGYDVFDPEGRFLGTVSSPLDLEEGLAFAPGVVYGVARDELDVPWVVKLRIERGG